MSPNIPKVEGFDKVAKSLTCVKSVVNVRKAGEDVKCRVVLVGCENSHSLKKGSNDDLHI